MANTERGEVRLDVDGTGYVLKLTLTHIVALQKRTNRPMGRIFDAVNEMDVEMIAALLWAALQVHHPRQFKNIDDVVVMMEQAGGLGELHVFIDAITDLAKANKSDVPAVEGAETNPPAAQSGGTVEKSTSELVAAPA